MSNIVNNIEKTSFNPRNMSREDLLKFLKLNKDSTTEEITNKISSILEDQDDPSIKNFLYLILYLLTKDSTNFAESVFAEQYLDNNPQNTTVLGPNITQIPTSQPSEFIYSKEVYEGKKNPRYIETYKSFLAINSALRPEPMTSPSEDFTLNVNFTNVLSIRLSSILINPSWYNFDHTFNNISFSLKGFTLPDPNKIFCVNIPPGYYNLDSTVPATDLITVLNNAIVLGAGGNPVSTYINFGYNPVSNKIDIANVPGAAGELIFYDPTLGYCDLSSCYISTLPKLNYNLGYYLGFRGPNFSQDGSLLTGQEGVTQENWENNSLIITWGTGKNEILPTQKVTAFGQINLNTSITAILTVDDFNSSTFSDNVQLVNPPNNKISLPNYYNKSIPCDISGSIPDTKKTTVFTQNPRKYTYAQLYTIQQILSQNSNNYYLTPALGNNGSGGNTLATFKLECGKTYYKIFSTDDNKPRLYSGEVNIGRLKITLSTINGIPLNLNYGDWEIVLEINQHYQNLNSQN